MSGFLTPALEMLVMVKDADGRAYMNDWVDINVLFGQSGQNPIYPLGPPAIQFITPFGTGAGQPGLIYPEIYLMENRQLLVDVWDQTTSANLPDLLINFIGVKVFKGARE